MLSYTGLKLSRLSLFKALWYRSLSDIAVRDEVKEVRQDGAAG